MKVEIFIRTPGENELVGTCDLHNPEVLDFPERIVDLLEISPNRELIIRQAKVPAEAPVGTWGGEF